MLQDTLPRAPAGSQPDYAVPAYRSTRARAPAQPLIALPPTVTECAGPRFDPAAFPPTDDLTARSADAGGGSAIGSAQGSAQGSAMGERIIVSGTVTDQDGRPLPHTMVEIWQANAAGRYNHPGDTHDAPLDPGFRGEGRVFTDAAGRYRFVTIKPGAYPWGNHDNAWRPNHIHFSLFGAGYAQRLITQMYFPGDPLLPLDPIYNAIADADARARLVAGFDLSLTTPGWALGYRFDIVLRGRLATPMEA